jgi:hypothetical protein
MSGLVQPPIPRFSGFGGTGGGGGGGGSGTIVTLTAADNLSLGSIVALDASGEAQLADPSLALSPDRFNAFGVAKAAVGVGNSAQIFTGMISAAPMLFAAAPLAADNGKRVYLSTTPGVATLTPTGTGTALVLLGILRGANGITTVPPVLLQFQVIALDT